MKIVIVEDNTTTRRELARLLESHGYETVLPDDFENPETMDNHSAYYNASLRIPSLHFLLPPLFRW